MKLETDPWERALYEIEGAERIAGDGVLLSEGERREISLLCSRAREELSAVSRTPLRIGLFGGTGVGKSSLINLFAGKVISVASHRRPFTDKVVAYVHRDARDLACPSGEIPCLVVSHEAEEARHLALFDLPDVDSNNPAHRELVSSFSRELDLCLWVVTPEKYADRAVFSAMEGLDRSRANYAFAVNKTDMLPDAGWREMLADFSGLLSRRGFGEAPVFAVSALDVESGRKTHGTQGFFLLLEWIFRKRETKELQEIRARNSVRELSLAMIGARERLARTARPEKLAHAVRSIQETSGEIAALARKEILALADPEAAATLLHHFSRMAPSPWPVSLFTGIIARFSLPEAPFAGRAAGPFFLETRLAAADRLAEAAASGLSGSPEPLAFTKILRGFVSENAGAANKEEGRRPPLLSRLRSALPVYLALAVPAFFFLLFLAGVESFSGLTGADVIKKLGVGIFNIPFVIFSPKGLFALFALIVIWALISLRLASSAAARRVVLVEKAMERISDGLAKEIVRMLDVELERVLQWTSKAEAEYRSIMSWPGEDD
ncbi:MAG: GTPase [Thermodesulfobacteriota bacterium]